MLKLCKKCGKEKDASLFDRSSSSPDGLGGKCKMCESIRQADKYRRKRDAISDRNQRWKDENRDKITAYNKKHYAKEIDRYRARALAGRALLRGDITKNEVCAMCGGRSEQGHHEDYSKPLEVVWLCRSCHKRRHAQIKEEQFNTSPV
jgi:hypothetical protein